MLRNVFWAFVIIVAIGLSVLFLVVDPDQKFPREWNPMTRLYYDDPVTLLTPWKLDAAAGDGALCLEVLELANVTFKRLPSFQRSAQCGIKTPVRLSRVGDASINTVDTDCATALRLAMWERHDIQNVAQEVFGQSVSGLIHVGSYNCRRVRGSATRMSTHATAMAIDISGFTLDDGTRIDLLKDWEGGGARSKFLNEMRDTSCYWFETVLGPDFNALHADHFHLQSKGWGTCR